MIDVFVPPVAKPYHEAVMYPASAATRNWVRHCSPPDKNFVSVMIEAGDDKAFEHMQKETGYPDNLLEENLWTLWDRSAEVRKQRCGGVLDDRGKQGLEKVQESKSQAVTLLNFGTWPDARASFFIQLNVSCFSRGQNDLYHEMGHALADLDHTIPEPAWFYIQELLHSGGPAAPTTALRMSNKPIYVDYLVNDGGWKYTYKRLEHGFGGAVRARIAQLKPGWLVANLSEGQPAWAR